MSLMGYLQNTSGLGSTIQNSRTSKSRTKIEGKTSYTNMFVERREDGEEPLGEMALD
jgi:hypothetical protein